MPSDHRMQYDEASRVLTKQWATVYDDWWEGRKVIWRLLQWRHYLDEQGIPCIEEVWRWEYAKRKRSRSKRSRSK